ncbi:hypothetical protein AU468_01115 [Alkalispirochaeta sphaeroplastigenens]|uniref:Uncharacterized protein n=1 Tax=Alkalispirochaeta sphaeroplastigenens TaxID=1187066 RepID=A0A2S4K173_9SPIO|nr:hypothetical protein [Alkalispirochaeta sphaeroplastigenens]POR05505.1 hypothetical protein AU468_01115 [Alkalispirochaeta sphaeroplastigenens]
MNQVPTKRGVRLLERLGGAMVILAAAAMVTAVACDTGTSSSSGPSWTSMLDDPQSGGTIGVIHFVIEALDGKLVDEASVTVTPDGDDLEEILEEGGTVTIEFDDFEPDTPPDFPESLDGFKLNGEITVEVFIGDGEESLTLSGSLATATSVQNISFQDAQLIFTKLPLGDHDEEPRSAEGEVKFGEDGSWHEMSGIVNALLAVSTSGRIIGDVLVKYAGNFMENPDGLVLPGGVSVTWIDEDSHSVRVTLTDYSPGRGDVTLEGDFDVTITPGTEGNPPEEIVLRGELSIENHTLGSISFDGSSGGLTLRDIPDEGGIPGDAQGWVITDSRRYNAGDLFSFGRFLEAMGIMGGD